MATPADALYTTPTMAGLFSGAAHVRQVLRFEAALARAEARAGVIPVEAADAIQAACRVELFDLDALYRDAAAAGTLAIPLTRRLASLVAGEGGWYVHWGATSQDAIDTATVLQVRAGLELLVDRLLAVGAACASLADRHRWTTMAGRTLLQQALPITFGLKSARWLALVTRQVERIRALGARILVVQLGGAAGTLASLGEQGPRVVELLAEELNLGVPELPWHAERDRVAEVAAALGIVAGAMVKIASDVALLAQTEVGEATEAAAPGKGGSSTLPHKRNPVDATLAIAAGRLAIGIVPVLLSAMVQEHERAVGSWQLEWAALPDLFRYTAGAVDHALAAVAGLVVDPDRMRANLELTNGLIVAEALSLALAQRLGRQEAHRVVEAASARAAESGRGLKAVALDDPAIRAALTPEAIERALEPDAYLGSAEHFVDRALARFREVQAPIGAE